LEAVDYIDKEIDAKLAPSVDRPLALSIIPSLLDLGNFNLFLLNLLAILATPKAMRLALRNSSFIAPLFPAMKKPYP